MSASDGRVGVWLIGGRGSVATMTVAGAAAVRAGLAGPTALVTEHEPFNEVPLVGLGGLAFGGCDVSQVTLAKRAERLALDGALPHGLAEAVSDALDEVEERIRPGIEEGGGESPAAALARVRADLEAFAEVSRADRVVVVNVSSTEAPVQAHAAHDDLDALRAALDAGEAVLPPSALYALAAFDAGCAFVEFTPSVGPRLPALDQAAHAAGVPYAGADGKTGQTLLRSALAPMFAARRLAVGSWAGTNVLGGGDGETLARPDRAESKLRSKTRALEQMLGAPVTAPLHIDNVPDMGEWKTSWDHIAFEGFLGVRMRMQVTWEGCDSALAAPLVIDLARLVAAAHRSGRAGALPELGFFFKEALDDAPQDLGSQSARLHAFAEALRPPA